MTDTELQEIIDSNKDKWGSYYDMLEAPEALLDDALEAAGEICFDAVNLEFELSSSTSGMYSSWSVRISPACTVYIDRFQKFSGGHGSTFSAALADFTLKLRKLTKEREEKVANGR